MNGQAFDALDPDHAHADGVGAMRRARGEDADLGERARRLHLGLPAASLLDVAVEDEDHPDVLPRVQPLEGVVEPLAGKELDGPGHVPRGGGLARGLGALGERRAHEADGLEQVLHRGQA